ncbi:MAG: 4Fe-4S binding protein [Planctomycetota bacterium]|jgi:pyruvate ferredoxin oxidoreductase delta subunit
MGMEKYEAFVRRARSTLTYTPGWSRDNLTGAWRSHRPVRNPKKCNDCGLCWLYCPDSCIDASTFEIDYRYCKGCGICAEECRVDAIVLKRETE